MKRHLLIFLLISVLAGVCLPSEVYAQKKSTTSKPKTESTSTKPKSKSTSTKPKSTSTSSKPKAERTRSSVNTDKSKNQKEIDKAQKDLRANKQKINQQVTQLNSIRADIDTQTAHIDRLNDSIINLNSEIATVSDSLRKLDKSIELLTKAYAENLRSQRHRRISLNDLTFIFSSETFSQAFSRLRYLGKLSTAQNSKAHTIKMQKQALEQKRDRLAKLRQQHQQMQNQLADARAEMERQQAQTEKLVDQLKQDGKGLQAYLDERQRIAQRLDQELQRIIQEEMRRAEEEKRKAEERRVAEEKRKAEEKRLAEEKRKAEQPKAQAQGTQTADNKSATSQPSKKQDQPAQSASASTPAKDKTTASASTSSSGSSSSSPTTETYDQAIQRATSAFEKNKGSLRFPCTGTHKIITRFGIVSHPTNPTLKIQSRGIDILATPGAKACAIFEGEVSDVKRMGDFNPYAIFVRHGNYIAVYSNISQPLVRKGDKVSTGQGLGMIYTDPDIKDSTQLHFEIHTASPRKELDPLLWIKG